MDQPRRPLSLEEDLVAVRQRTNQSVSSMMLLLQDPISEIGS